MHIDKEFLILVVAFILIVAASNTLSKIFEKIKLPLITGFITIGVIAGPYLLNMLPGDIHKIEFINDISLAFIAIASGAEIYLKEIRDKIRNIGIMSASQFFITFIVSFGLLYILADHIPFLREKDGNIKLAISLLVSTIFIARSPASAIAIINELRAKGPFTKISLGVTIVKDIFVILLFAIVFSISEVLVTGLKFDFVKILIVIINIILSIGLGWVYAKVIGFTFRFNLPKFIQLILLLAIGWSMFALSHFVRDITTEYINATIHLEALLVGIIASFVVTNYSKYRLNLLENVEELSPYVYPTFFTFIGATINLDLLLKYWPVAFLLFGIRFISIVIASFTGSLILRDTFKKTIFSWTPYITQAGVSIGLLTIIADHFQGFGYELEVIIIAVIIINQFVGPPLFKLAIISVGESHLKSNDYQYDFNRDLFVFGVGGKAILFAKTMKSEGFNVNIVTDKVDIQKECTEIDIKVIDRFDFENFEKINFKTCDVAIIFRREEIAYEICELIYEKYGIPNIIVVAENHFKDVERFNDLDVTVVAPTSAIISLLVDFVKSPQAASILLGLREERETVDIEVLAKDVHGRAMRDLSFPLGTLIISLKRNNDIILPHGYTRFRLHDIVTVVGTKE